ncbi:MAG: helix-turn-helix domain-containing protein [Anaerolineae bacterium]
MLNLGEKLRAVRVSKNLSLRELAARAEVSASLLSQIENGKANPSVRSLHSIADALSMPVDYFFPSGNSTEARATADGELSPENLTPGELRAAQDANLIDDADLGFDEKRPSKEPVVRALNRPTIDLLGGITWERLTPGPEENIEFLQICYEVGAKSGEKMSHHNGREFHYVLAGELLLELGFERYLLQAGDSIIFDSTTPHRLSNGGTVPMRAITVIFGNRSGSTA